MIARKFFNLPYRDAIVDYQRSGNQILFTSPNSVNISVEVTNKPLTCPLSTWLTERYSLYSPKENKMLRGDVIHDSWQLKKCLLTRLDDQFSPQFGFNSINKELHCAYSDLIDVRFKPFKFV